MEVTEAFMEVKKSFADDMEVLTEVTPPEATSTELQ